MFRLAACVLGLAMAAGRTLLGEGHMGPCPNDATFSLWRIGDMKGLRTAQSPALVFANWSSILSVTKSSVAAAAGASAASLLA